MDYRLISDHAEDLEDGRVLEPGEFYTLDEVTARIQQLVDDGKLISVSAAKEPAATDAARKAAADADVPLSAITGTGADGQIILPDVEKHIAEQEGGEE